MSMEQFAVEGSAVEEAEPQMIEDHPRGGVKKTVVNIDGLVSRIFVVSQFRKPFEL